jgi:hypothetical protein
VSSHRCEVELVPGDDLGSRPPREDTESKATQQRRCTDVDCHRSKLAVPPHELDVRDPRQPPSTKLEDLGVKDVASQQELVVGKLVFDRVGRDHDLFGERSDGRPWHPTTPASDSNPYPNNSRIRLAEHDDQVVDLPDPRPVGSSDRAPELVGEHDATLIPRSTHLPPLSAVPVP